VSEDCGGRAHRGRIPLPDYNSKIRLCPSLYRLADSPLQADRDGLQRKAQKILDHWIRTRNKGPINPFDPGTYKNLLKKLGHMLDETMNKIKLLDALEDFKESFVNDQDLTQVEIYATWILYFRQAPQQPAEQEAVPKAPRRFMRNGIECFRSGN
jgi:hypothetical protein